MSSSRLDAFKGVIATTELPDLGPGPRPGVLPAGLLTERIASLATSMGIPAPVRTQLQCAALLWHDHHDPAHALAQEDHTSEGSWMHAIVHRREPDYSNSKYWFRKVGRHPRFPRLAEAVASLRAKAENTDLSKKLLPEGEWDPFAFVDACAKAAGRAAQDPAVTRLRQIQALEFDQLLEHLVCSADH
jgi:hypothetical protein